MTSSEHCAESTATVRRRDVLAVAGTALLAGCRGTPESDGMSRTNGGGSTAEWATIELSTVRGDEAFTIDDLDAPVVVQPFAVRCADCERQSSNLVGLTASATVLSLNIDRSEDAAAVREHANANGFDWRFAVASTTLKNELITAFGPSVTEARNTPVIVLCDGGTTEYRSGSIASTAELEGLVAEC
jgi:hypothetical protein